MNYEPVFDGRNRDPDTGKLSIDKMRTLNSNSCLKEMIDSGTSDTYEYLLARSIERERKEEREQEHQDWLESIRRNREREQREQREWEERQEEERKGIRLRPQQNLVREVGDVRLVYLGGARHMESMDPNIRQNT